MSANAVLTVHAVRVHKNYGENADGNTDGIFAVDNAVRYAVRRNNGKSTLRTARTPRTAFSGTLGTLRGDTVGNPKTFRATVFANSEAKAPSRLEVALGHAPPPHVSQPKESIVCGHCKKLHTGGCSVPGDPNCVTPLNTFAKTCPDYEEHRP